MNCSAHKSNSSCNLFFAQLTESASYATCMPFLHCTDSPSVAVVRCKMKGLFVVVVATLVSQGKARLPCKLVSQITVQGQPRITCKILDHSTSSIYLQVQNNLSTSSHPIPIIIFTYIPIYSYRIRIFLSCPYSNAFEVWLSPPPCPHTTTATTTHTT